MFDGLFLTVLLSVAGTIVGLIAEMRLKARKVYFDELDALLSRYAETLNFGMDTVPELLKSYAPSSKLLGRHIASALASMSAGSEHAELSGGYSAAAISLVPFASGGYLTKAETAFVGKLFADLGTGNAESEKNRVARDRVMLSEYKAAAADKYARMGKAGIKLGFLFGLLLSVLFW